jgi:uncharacterized membrane protein YkoI
MSPPTIKEDPMRRRIFTGAAVLGAMALGGSGIAAASGGSSGGETATAATPGDGSRLDDGAILLPQANITEQQAIRAAQSAASGPLNEVDLEDYNGRLVFNVDVGASDVKVDASNGNILATPSDD